jgi:catechol 2,3-dioxygenase-like lactoylglutathione lyase family enzyme
MKLEPLIYVSNLAESIRFYAETLGFKLGELFPDKDNPTYAPIFIDENKLMLVLARKTNKKFYPKGLAGSGVQFFIQVEDADKV